MKDKISIRKDELVILVVPADQKEIKTAHEGRKLTLAEWKRFFPKPQFKWNKE